MIPFYSVPIPTPHINADLQLVAKLSYNNNCVIVYWRKETRQAVIHKIAGGWFIQPDGLIVESLSTLFNCKPTNIIIKSLFLKESPQNDELADEEATLSFYECEWSDYACDNISLSFSVDINPESITTRKQLFATVRAFIKDEEECADMPALIPVENHLRELVSW